MDKEKLRQAAEEFGWTFIALFGFAFFGYVSGWSKFPDPSEFKAAAYAALVSAVGGAAKSVLWYFTGTKREVE